MENALCVAFAAVLLIPLALAILIKAIDLYFALDGWLFARRLTITIEQH